MPEMTSRERFQRMFDHKEADRVPITDIPWSATIERWRSEGMPADASFVDYFGLDRIERINVSSSPRYEAKVLEETDEYRIHTTAWGATLKNWKHAASTPEFLDFTIVDRDTWERAKARMAPGRDRVDWDYLKENYPQWREKGSWIEAGLWFGFDVTHAWIVGTERLLMALVEDPEWCMDMFRHQLENRLVLLDMVWEAGYEFDAVCWPDDMGYKNNQFFSVKMYRELLKPFHRRAVEWAHAKGVRAELHSCGNINPFVPELVDIGLDGLNPLEVKAGMNPLQLKADCGDNLLLHGGLNAVLWDKPEGMFAEMERVVPAMKRDGGYILSSDHSVPSSVSLESFREFVELGKRLGAY